MNRRRLPKYVKGWIDRRDGRVYHYLRRPGYPPVRLSGLPWSPSFMAEYEKAISGPRAAIGAGRVKPGSVAAVIAAYRDSHKILRLEETRHATHAWRNP
jgi:hypothetical protein